MDVIDEVLMIFAGTRGHLDDVPLTRVAEWEHDFLIFMKDQRPEIRKKIADTKDLDDETAAALTKAIGDFKAQFATKKTEEKK
jgi:F-type H+-transporting ATPase subunit alpha